MLRLLTTLALLAMPMAGSAKWMEASSPHFVIYADDTPTDIQRFSQQLERFHGAMALMLERSEDGPPSPSNRVTVYVVKSDREVRKLAGDKTGFTYAFYQPRAGGSYAIVPTISSDGDSLSFSMIALLHEYAHHFQLSTSRENWPRWFVEGSAEFFASAKFEKDGNLTLGLAAQHRAAELFHAPDVSVTDLLDPDTYEKRRRKGFDAYYGKAWLLYHYLTFSQSRKGQFPEYLRLLRSGKSSIEAARAAFGDLAVLEKDVERYKLGKLTALRLNPGLLKTSPVTLRELSAGEAVIMPVRIRSRRGVTREEAIELVPEARAIAARFPSDAAVLTALAEAEVDSGNPDAAITAADAALALDPRQVNAHIQKGLALFEKAETAQDKAKAYRDARAAFLKLNQIENDHPLPLMYFYMSYLRQGAVPGENAVNALERASELAPFDLGLRYTLVMQQIRDKRYEDAAFNLAPIAYNPHGSGTEKARKLLDRLKENKEITPVELEALMAADETEGEEPSANR
ncbi:MAG: DUF1570 domain-containing protein [Sphingomonas sp.]|nr:DUF1570 domain-containing protein [Sphingomonas sp.]